jgi:hypothetical protein
MPGEDAPNGAQGEVADVAQSADGDTSADADKGDGPAADAAPSADADQGNQS